MSHFYLRPSAPFPQLADAFAEPDSDAGHAAIVCCSLHRHLSAPADSVEARHADDRLPELPETNRIQACRWRRNLPDGYSHMRIVVICHPILSSTLYYMWPA